MNRVPRGQRGGGQFAPGRSGFTPPTAPGVTSPASNQTPRVGAASNASVESAHQAYTAALAESQGSIRCDVCGQFTPLTGGHSCVRRMSVGKQVLVTTAPAMMAAGTFGVTAAALALGPVAMGVVAAAVLVGFGLRGLFQRVGRAAVWVNATDDDKRFYARVKRTKKENEAFDFAEQAVTDLAAEMNVDGRVAVFYRKAGSPAAMHLGKGRSVVVVTADLLEMPKDHKRSILAHEVAHLQPQGTKAVRVRTLFAKAAFPVAFGAAAVSGLAALPAAALGAGVWYASKSVSSAVSRREERRADRAAYQVSGEAYADALTDISEKSGTIRHDLPWRVEDVVFSHGNLPNRLQDMRA